MKRVHCLIGIGMMALCWGVPSAMAQVNIDQEIAKLKLEPNVRAVQEAALRYFRVNGEQVSSMRTRASWKAVVPVAEVSGGFARSTIDEDTFNFEVFNDETLYSKGLTQVPWVVKGSGGDAFEIRGKLTWNLPRLIFNAEELDVASLAGLMEGLLKEATRLYFMRRRLQVDLILTPPTDQATYLSKQLRMEELTGLIDAMTGGWFQRSLTRKNRKRPGGSAPKAVVPTRKK
jgi:hypothetical protein